MVPGFTESASAIPVIRTASFSTPAILADRAAGGSVAAEEDPRQRQRALAHGVPEKARDVAVEVVAGDRGEELPDPAAGEPEGDDPAAHLDQVGAPCQLHLSPGAPLGAELVVAL